MYTYYRYLHHRLQISKGKYEVERTQLWVIHFWKLSLIMFFGGYNRRDFKAQPTNAHDRKLNPPQIMIFKSQFFSSTSPTLSKLNIAPQRLPSQKERIAFQPPFFRFQPLFFGAVLYCGWCFPLQEQKERIKAATEKGIEKQQVPPLVQVVVLGLDFVPNKPTIKPAESIEPQLATYLAGKIVMFDIFWEISWDIDISALCNRCLKMQKNLCSWKQNHSLKVNQMSSVFCPCQIGFIFGIGPSRKAKIKGSTIIWLRKHQLFASW